MNKGKHFTRVCLDCGKVMENVAGNLRFCASCRRERHNQYCRDYRAHNEKPTSVMWYTVWDAKTGKTVYLADPLMTDMAVEDKPVLSAKAAGCPICSAVS